MIKLDESAEQLKEATEVTFSQGKTCAKLFALIQNSGSLKYYNSMLLAFFLYQALLN